MDEGRENGRRLAAEVVGAIEGLLESLDDHDLEQAAADAARQARRVTNATMGEVRNQSQTPEGRQLRDAAQSGWETTRHAAEAGWESTRDAAQSAAHSMQEGYETVKDAVEEGAHRVEDAAETVVAETRARNDAFQRARQRSKRAPRAIWSDLRSSMQARRQGMAASMGMYALAGLVALAGFVALTIAMVNGLTEWAGSPEGAFLTAGIYFLAAFGAILAGRRIRRNKQEEADEHMEDARREVQNVTRPLRRAFAMHRITSKRASPRQRVGEQHVPAAQQQVPEAPSQEPMLEHEWRRR